MVWAYSTCFSRQVVVLVVGQQLGQDEQRVERRAQLVAHVGQELALVLGAHLQLLGLFLQLAAGRLDLAVLLLHLAVLLGQQRRLLLQLLVDLLQLLLLVAQGLFRRLERAGLLLQLGVGAPQLFLLRLQLLRLALQLLREVLRLLQQLLGAHVGGDHVEHHAHALRQLVQEHLVDLAEREEAGQLDHGLDVALEEDGQHHDVARRRLAQPAGDADVVVGHPGEQDRLLLQRRLAHQPLARPEPVR